MRDKEYHDLKKVLFAGPDMRAQGGIAAVMRTYDRTFGPVSYLPTTSRLGKAAGMFRFALSLIVLPLYRLRGFRILHAHGSVRGSFPRKRILLRWAKALGMHTVHHIHSGNLRDFCEQKGVLNIARELRNTDAVAALSPYWCQYLCETLKLTNVHVIRNVVQPTVIPSAQRPHKPLQLLYLGAIMHTKGIFDLLETIADNHERLKDMVHLHIGGDGKERQRMNDMIARNGLEDIVSTHGWVSGEEKDRLLAECDVLVLPSYAEGMPICILEAMAAGMAVITTPVGGIAEMVVDGRNGIIISPGDKNSIMDAIEHLALNPEEIKTMGERNLESVYPHLPETVFSQLIDLYRKISNAPEN